MLAGSKLMKEKLKSQLAVITAEYLAEGMSVAKAEVNAKADPRYREYLLAAQRAVEKAEVARAEMKSIEIHHEWRRSQESSKRAEMKIL